MSELPVRVGDRIRLAEYRGTVRYIGRVEGREGNWVGVEWDDVSRGKHNGTVHDVRYFETENDAPSGSFVPSEKFLNGTSLVNALRRRYTNLDNDFYDDEDMFLSVTGKKTMKIELVGLSQIEGQLKNLQLLRTADMVGSSISSIGPTDVLSQLMLKLVELNLAFNFVRDWRNVSQLIEALPRLSVLNLSGNPFLRGNSGFERRVLKSKLKTLVLNECQLSWNQVMDLAFCLPDLKEVQLCYNELAELTPPKGFEKMEVMDLAFNRISDWNEVCKLCKLPRLRRFNLTSNPLKTVEFKSEDPEFFKSLESLLLGDCLIDNWPSVNALNLFPSLKETRVSGNPLLHSIPGGGRYEIVARVGGLTQLNGSRISPQERIDCERRYMSHVATSLAQGKIQKEEIPVIHPRYADLIKKHGEPTASISSLKQTGALRDYVIEVTLICHAPSAGTKMGSHTKKVPMNMTLGTLKTLAEQLFGVAKSKMKVFLKGEDGSFPEDISDVKDDKRLGDLYFVDGQQVLINE